MKGIEYYIHEGEQKITKKQLEILMSFVNGIFSTSKSNVQDIISMLNGVPMETLKEIGHWYVENDMKNATFYIPNDDQYLAKENYDKIRASLAEYIVKFVQKN